MHTYKRIFYWAIVLVTLAFSASAARVKPEKSTSPVGNRYLFIVENSSSMQSRDEAIRQVVFDFINTGVRGRMQSGDTFGVWTFNSSVDTRFPMQRWEPANRLDLGTRVNIFLRNQGYQRRSKLDSVMTDLESLVQAVDNLTVILLVDGLDRIKGTPFDNEVNAVFREIGPDLARSNQPLVAALQVKDGAFVAYSVVAPGEALLLPPALIRPQPASRIIATAIASSPVTNAPVRKVAPIIMSRDGLDPEARPSGLAGTSPPRAPMVPPVKALEVAKADEPRPAPAIPATHSTPLLEAATNQTAVQRIVSSAPVTNAARSDAASAHQTVSGVESKVPASSTPSPRTNVVHVVKTTVPPIAEPPIVAEASSEPPGPFPLNEPPVPSSPLPKSPSASGSSVASTRSEPQISTQTGNVVSLPAREMRKNAVQSASPHQPAPPVPLLVSSNRVVPGSLLTSPIPVHARERGAAPSLSISNSDRSPLPLAVAGTLFTAALCGAWIWYQKSRAASKGSYISRVLPTPGSQTSRRPPPRGQSDPS